MGTGVQNRRGGQESGSAAREGQQGLRIFAFSKLVLIIKK